MHEVEKQSINYLKKLYICLQVLLSFFIKYLRNNISHGKKLVFKLETHCTTHQKKNLMKSSGLILKPLIFSPYFCLSHLLSSAFNFHFASVFHLSIYFFNHLMKNSRDAKRIHKILCVLFQ